MSEFNWPGDPAPQSFDEKMREGKSLEDGIAGSMEIKRGLEKSAQRRTERMKKFEELYGYDD